MITTGLNSLVRTLPTRTEPLVAKQWDPSFSEIVTMPNPYVWPELSSETHLSGSPILLLTAPGAMGKSAAARAVASTVKAPLIDLAKLPVGSDSLTGLLTRTLGWGQAAGFISDLVTGNSAVVLDALDEAQLLAGREHFAAFLRNVEELIQGATPKLQVVMFGRRDAVETIYLTLEEHGVRSAMATVAPMNRRSANELINVTLDRKATGDGKPYAVHRLHPGPSSMLRDQLFRDIASAYLGRDIEAGEVQWADAQQFLGYPPVLMALAEWLAVDNPAAGDPLAQKDSHQRSGRSRRGYILRRVVEEIMDRERSKVGAQLAGPLGLVGSDPLISVLYTRNEQALRVASYLVSRTDAIAPPASLDPIQRATYEDRIAMFVPDHPFLSGRSTSNVVFQDYLLAFLATDPLPGLHRELFAATRAGLRPGPFFAHFVHAIAHSSGFDLSGPGMIADEELVDDLIQSYKAGCTRQHAVQYLHLNVERPSLILVEDCSGGDLAGDVLVFELENPSGVLALSGRIGNTFIVSRHGIVLNASGKELELGPNLNVFAELIELRGERINAYGPPPGDSDTPATGSVVVVGREVNHDPRVQVSAYPPEALHVAWPDPWFGWRPFVMEPFQASSVVDATLAWQIMFGLRRILLSFRGRARATPTIVPERMDGFVVAHNGTYQAVLNGLIELSIVRRSNIYELDLENLAAFGISYNSLQTESFVKTLEGLHSAVCRSEAVKPLLG